MRKIFARWSRSASNVASSTQQQKHVVFVDVGVADFERPALVAEDLEAERQIETFLLAQRPAGALTESAADSCPGPEARGRGVGLR